MVQFPRSIEELEADIQAAPDGIAQIDLLIQLTSRLSDDNPVRALEIARAALVAAEEIRYTQGLAIMYATIGKCENILLSPDAALTSLQKSLLLSEELDDPALITRALTGIGVVHMRTGKLTDALETLLRGLHICEITGDINGTRVIKGNLGIVYSQLCDYPLALYYHKENLRIARQLENNRAIAYALNGLGNALIDVGDYTGALSCLLEGAALALTEHINPIYYMCLGNIGNVYNRMGNSTGALEYFLQALKKAEEIQDGVGQATCMFHIGSIYAELGNTANALNYYLKSMSIFERTHDRYGESNVLEGIADLFLEIGEPGNALDYAHKALELRRSIGSRDGEARVLCQIGRFYLTGKDTTTALSYLTQALEIAESIKTLEILATIHTVLATVYKQTGKTARSRHHTKEHKKLSSQFFTESDQKQIAHLLQNFEKEQVLREAQLSGTDLPDQSMTAELWSLTGKIQAKGLAIAPGFHHTTVTATARREIVVQTFGRFTVTLDGQELTPEDWQRKKARDIFKVLLINYCAPVSTDELIDLLWQDSAGKNLIPTIWNSISYIRKALEPDLKPQMPSSYIKIVEKSYLLDLGEDAHIDFLQFRQTIKEARVSNAHERRALNEQAIALYSGEFLKEDIYEEWSCFERESLKEMYLEALLQTASDYHEAGDTDNGLHYAKRAVETDRTCEEAYEMILTILRENSQFAEARKVMQQCRDAFQKELASPPPKHLERMISQNTSDL